MEKQKVYFLQLQECLQTGLDRCTRYPESVLNKADSTVSKACGCKTISTVSYPASVSSKYIAEKSEEDTTDSPRFVSWEHSVIQHVDQQHTIPGNNAGVCNSTKTEITGIADIQVDTSFDPIKIPLNKTECHIESYVHAKEKSPSELESKNILKANEESQKEYLTEESVIHSVKKGM